MLSMVILVHIRQLCTHCIESTKAKLQNCKNENNTRSKQKLVLSPSPSFNGKTEFWTEIKSDLASIFLTYFLYQICTSCSPNSFIFRAYRRICLHNLFLCTNNTNNMVKQHLGKQIFSLHQHTDSGWMTYQVYTKDHFVYAPSQWETTLQCNVVSHWLGAYTKWSLWYYLNLNPHDTFYGEFSLPVAKNVNAVVCIASYDILQLICRYSYYLLLFF